MKVQSTIKPNPFAIKDDTVIFAENIVSVEIKNEGQEDDTLWQYDEYKLKIRPRKNFENYIEDNYAVLIERAKENQFIQEMFPDKEISGNISIDDVKNALYQKIDNYKHEKSKWFEYDGHMQRYLEFDRITMRDCQEALQDGHMASVRWKYPTAYVDVVDGAYFFTMRLVGAQNLTMCFEVEKMMRGELELLEDIEDLMAYDYKEKFDSYLNDLQTATVE